MTICADCGNPDKLRDRNCVECGSMLNYVPYLFRRERQTPHTKDKRSYTFRPLKKIDGKVWPRARA